MNTVSKVFMFLVSMFMGVIVIYIFVVIPVSANTITSVRVDELKCFTTTISTHSTIINSTTTYSVHTRMFSGNHTENDFNSFGAYEGTKCLP